MRVVLFGGAFDPPHYGHQQVATGLLNQRLADEVWFVPVKKHSFEKHMSAPEHRVAMLQHILVPHTKIETYELEQAGVNYTFNTLDALSARYPEHSFSWVIGSDNLSKFHLWGDAQGRNYQDLLKAHPFWVYPRHGFPFQPLYEGMTALPNLPEVTVSSTQIRAYITQGKTTQNLTPQAVSDYSKEQQLYTREQVLKGK